MVTKFNKYNSKFEYIGPEELVTACDQKGCVGVRCKAEYCPGLIDGECPFEGLAATTLRKEFNMFFKITPKSEVDIE